jgi:hypothetical protein
LHWTKNRHSQKHRSDTEEWKITHLEIELKKEIAGSVLGVKKGGVRNMLAVSAL